jgi:hypothetical protein
MAVQRRGKRRWKRYGRKLYQYNSPPVWAFIFGHATAFLWGWRVRGREFSKQGVTNSLREARAQANQAIDAIEMQQDSTNGGVR